MSPLKRYGPPKRRGPPPRVLYGTAGAVVVGLVIVWVVLRSTGYQTIDAGSRVLAHGKYITVDFEVARPDALLEIAVEGRQERPITAYLFTQDEYTYFAKVTDGRGAFTREFQPVWGRPRVMQVNETDLPLPGPGKYLFVVLNSDFNEASAGYRISGKRLR
jgi:hypothetical protein